ncbi:MAG TPA: response regulator [Chthoniobacteraceae bacterium]|jgi:CheY-like chemotaxis protein|nr:response regulator [Chthoniobacteraceae bacterium]
MPAPTYAASRLKILAVDDDPSSLQLLARLFEQGGHLFRGAYGGLNALDQFEAGQWDIFLTDREMPLMGGEELAARIKELSPFMPIILMTGRPPATPCPQIDFVLEKPFSRAGLIAAIDRCLADAFDCTHPSAPSDDAFPAAA